MAKTLKEDLFQQIKGIEDKSYVDEKGHQYTLKIRKEQGLTEEFSFYARYDDGTERRLTSFFPTPANRHNLEHRSLSQPKYTRETSGIGMWVDKSHADNPNPQLFLAPTPYYKE